jgi:hypothetical protein
MIRRREGRRLPEPLSDHDRGGSDGTELWRRTSGMACASPEKSYADQCCCCRARPHVDNEVSNSAPASRNTKRGHVAVLIASCVSATINVVRILIILHNPGGC